MVHTDRDLTDQGIRRDESPMTAAEHRAARAALVAELGADALAPADTGPAATSGERARIMRDVRRRMGWGASRADRLSQPCPTCGVDALTWCRKGGFRWAQPTHGRICEARGQTG
jgi:hypothetical protein